MKVSETYVCKFRAFSMLRAMTMQAGFDSGNVTKYESLFIGLRNRLVKTKRKNLNKVLNNITRKYNLNTNIRGIKSFGNRIRFDKNSIRKFLEQLNLPTERICK